MKINTLLKYILPVILLGGIVGGGTFYILVLQGKITKTTAVKIAKVIPDKLFGWKFPVAKFPMTGSDGKLIAYSSIRDPGGVNQGLPVRLKIPVIGVDTAIEDALITPDGRMDVPANSVNVAWFALGPHPGKVGSAVIGGHYGIDNGVPKVFYKLDKLVPGNKVYIVDDGGNTLAFVVKRIQLFDRNADSTTVFTSGDGIAHLNIITCEGVWNQVNDSYPDRRVVFTDLIPGEGPVTVNTAPPAAAKPTSAKSVAMAASPTPTLTPSSTPGPSDMPTMIPAEAINPSIFPNKIGQTSQILILSANSLFATPEDVIITSLLLIAIGFMTVKIIKR